MIAIIDYGMGNLRSVQKAFEAVGQHAVVTRERQAIQDATHLVLPGVGAFADCMANLERYGLIQRLRQGLEHSLHDVMGDPAIWVGLGAAR